MVRNIFLFYLVTVFILINACEECRRGTLYSQMGHITLVYVRNFGMRSRMTF